MNGKGGGWLVKSICSHNIQNPINPKNHLWYIQGKKKHPLVESVDPRHLTFYSAVFDSVSR